jgi:hypothetical protein
MVWLIKQKQSDSAAEDDILKNVASYAVSCIEQLFELHYNSDGSTIYRARIPLLQPEVSDIVAKSELMKVVNILENSTKKLFNGNNVATANKTCLQNLSIFVEGSSIVIEVKGEYRAYLKQLYPSLLESINLNKREHSDQFKSSIATIKAFDFSRFQSKQLSTESVLKDLQDYTELTENKKDKAA